MIGIAHLKKSIENAIKNHNRIIGTNHA